MGQTDFPYPFVAFLTAVSAEIDEVTHILKPEGLTPVQFTMLGFIGVNRRVTPSLISERMPMSMPNTSRELKKLREKGLCERVEDPKDRRKQYVRLSREGEGLINDVFAQIEDRFHERVKLLTDKDRLAISQAMELLHTKVFTKGPAAEQ
ncbi:MAG: MarR family transcriptional regulator [Paenibacillaceae bacterium]|uniref:MarR family transcriptional regulator n=1 Tax=Paenibacillus mellifer TaxID=2937794 RepID=A0A9X1Y0J0_9BACL|nr:MarR family transcriptional regulator [Paenibacillus mellifer]MBW4838707.1 MarR family transcriptional regulator [Paenibacillaceae bacterium]MCK8489340.1 MarR family transcriptional regulator [Paenibacillus mellifer]